jgi:N-acetylornithine carbamoyltransferase
MKRMKQLWSLAEMPREEIVDLLALAARLETVGDPQALAGRILGLLFFNPSLRTLASMQAAMAKLGGTSFVVSPGASSWKLETRSAVVMDGEASEHVREAIPVLAGYADVLGVRAFASGNDLAADLADSSFRALAALAVPVINLESAIDHPCQALADWKTLDDLGVARHGKLVLSWANHPKALPLAVPAAVLRMAALRGMEVTVLRPEAYALPEPLLAEARSLAAGTGGSVRETAERPAALDNPAIVYAKSWASAAHYGDAAAERELRADLASWCVEESWFERAPEARFMHCLPVRRNVVVADAVLDSPRSVVVQQAHNRLWAQMAVALDFRPPWAGRREAMKDGPENCRSRGAQHALPYLRLFQGKTFVVKLAGGRSRRRGGCCSFSNRSRSCTGWGSASSSCTAADHRRRRSPSASGYRRARSTAAG